MAGPATPNQLMLPAAASPVLEGAPPTPGLPTFDLPSMGRAGFRRHAYGGDACQYLTSLKGHLTLRESERFAPDARGRWAPCRGSTRRNT